MTAEQEKNKATAKPFVKWAGGKGSLICQLIENLPQDFAEQPNVTYIEPFVGGGAMLFYMLTHYPNIKRAVINDVNEDLINCYLLIKNDPEKLISSLREIKDEYYRLVTIEAKSQYYYQMREKYNNEDLAKEKRAAYLYFLIRLVLMVFIGSILVENSTSHLVNMIILTSVTRNSLWRIMGYCRR